MTSKSITTSDAIQFLKDQKKYWMQLASTEKEDMGVWAAIYNAENCQKIANLIKELRDLYLDD